MKASLCKSFVLQRGQGEVLRLRPPARSGEVIIKVDPRNTGSTRMAMGTQRIQVSGNIPVHLHERQDEILVVHAGRGTVSIGEEQEPISTGSTIFIPQGAWHGVENTGDEPLHLVWVICPPGLEGMFREIGSPTDQDFEPLTPEEFAAAARRHGMRVK